MVSHSVRVFGNSSAVYSGMFTRTGAHIAHLKVFAQAATGYIKASICRNGDEPGVEGALDAPPARAHMVVLNLRAGASPELLLDLVDRAAALVPGRVKVVHREAFRPAAPHPEHRFTSVVKDETPV